MTFFQKNRVFIIGLISAILVAVEQYATGPIDYKVIGYAALMAVISYFANNLKGDIATIIGIIGTDLTSIIPSLISHTPISWLQLAIQTLAAITALLVPSPTSSTQAAKLAIRR